MSLDRCAAAVVAGGTLSFSVDVEAVLDGIAGSLKKLDQGTRTKKSEGNAAEPHVADEASEPEAVNLASNLNELEEKAREKSPGGTTTEPRDEAGEPDLTDEAGKPEAIDPASGNDSAQSPETPLTRAPMTTTPAAVEKPLISRVSEEQRARNEAYRISGISERQRARNEALKRKRARETLKDPYAAVKCDERECRGHSNGIRTCHCGRTGRCVCSGHHPT